KQKLLAGLAARVKRARDLSAPERTIGKHSSVFTSKGHTLGDALVDDIQADLSQTVNVGFAGSKVAAFYRVINQSINTLAVILLIVCGVDTTLSCDAVGASRTILKAEALDVVPELRHGCRGGCAG